MSDASIVGLSKDEGFDIRLNLGVHLLARREGKVHGRSRVGAEKILAVELLLHLVEHDVYAPQLWPEVVERVLDGEEERRDEAGTGALMLFDIRKVDRVLDRRR